MKKIILIAIALAGLTINSQANSFTYINMTGCTYTLEIAGVDQATSTFFSSPFTLVPVGTTVYSTPSSIPGLPWLSGTVNFHYVKGWINSTPGVSFVVGNLPATVTTSTVLPATTCYPQGGNTVYFNGNSTGGNVVVLIM